MDDNGMSLPGRPLWSDGKSMDCRVTKTKNNGGMGGNKLPSVLEFAHNF
jgi:hypothetical protein